ncbi:zinc-finger homeodomain protein 9 [Brachypodium distachyon]|uniref:ZF-HD dimerization-type domain-containing protein n=1 Tax=Brachypodium distachyon TaxID=15368 RepID=I1IQ45_BRADI|nr:zinc-finger homeodomain protein 9 [Brachypodium distachyon]KQJ90232.1 hypothetical protein BRADI_4g30240v3 [Brachypodium distachyon]|eukprot:XP_003576527.1 zinc-finger homeodomain protein 9 [Brachypodium distachyon]
MDVKYKPVAFPNGSAKKPVKPAAAAVAMAPPPPSSQVVTYQDCLRNHAANLGAHAVDGCREFLPTPENNPADPWSLKCAACGCHRNFHRRVLVEDSPPPLPQQRRGEEETPVERLPGVDSDSDSDGSGSGYDDERSMSPPPPTQQHQPPVAHNPAPVAQQPPAPPGAYFSPALAPAPHMLLSLNSSSAPGAAQQRLPVSPVAAAQMVPAGPVPAQHLGAMPMMPAQRKRFRTKFTLEQKKRMQELSERLGWRLQKRDEAIVDDRCRDIGVSKGVFKVWMHNNKHNYLGGHSARRSASASSAVATTTTASGADAAAAPPPPFNPSEAPAATGFNMNGTGGHPVNGGASSSQSA